MGGAVGDEVRAGRELGHPVRLAELGAQPARGHLGELGVERRRGGQDEREGGEVAALEGGVLGHREDDRRRDVGPRDPVLLEDVDELREVEPRQDDDRRALPQRHVHQHGHPVDVEERQDGDDPVLGAHRVQRVDLGQVHADARVGEHHALGQARGAARVGQDRDVLGGVHLHVGHGTGRREQFLHAAVALDLVAGPDRTVAGRLDRDRQQRADGDHHRRLAVVELVGHVLGRGQRAQRRHRGAGTARPVEHHRVEHRVRAVQRDDVARLDPELGETGRHPVDHLRQLGVGDRLPGDPVDQGRMVAAGGRAGEHGLVDRGRRGLDGRELTGVDARAGHRRRLHSIAISGEMAPGGRCLFPGKGTWGVSRSGAAGDRAGRRS